MDATVKLRCANVGTNGCGKSFRGPRTACFCPSCWGDLIDVESGRNLGMERVMAARIEATKRRRDDY